jgi:hypothetical protein
MGKTVADIARALKLRAVGKNNGLSLRLGVKKHTLPFEVRYINSPEYVFVHIPPAAAILRHTADGLVEVTDPEEAAKAQAAFRKPRRQGARQGAAKDIAVPAELHQALKKIPPGFKIGYGPDGEIRLLRARKRRSSKA